MVGEYSVRGGILDVFPAENSRPARVEFFGDEIESIRQFDVESQRSVLKITATTLLPLAEYPRSRPFLASLPKLPASLDLELSNPGEMFPGWEFLVPLVRPRSHNLFSSVPDAIVVMDEPPAIASAADRLWQRLENPDAHRRFHPARTSLRWLEWNDNLKDRTTISFEELPLGGAAHFHIPTRPSLTFQGNMPVAVAEARNLIQAGNRVAFFALRREKSSASPMCCRNTPCPIS